MLKHHNQNQNILTDPPEYWLSPNGPSGQFATRFLQNQNGSNSLKLKPNKIFSVKFREKFIKIFWERKTEVCFWIWRKVLIQMEITQWTQNRTGRNTTGPNRTSRTFIIVPTGSVLVEPLGTSRTCRLVPKGSGENLWTGSEPLMVLDYQGV